MTDFYGRTDTLFYRDPVTHKMDISRYYRPEFAVIGKWLATTKIDGTNASLCFGWDEFGDVTGDFRGRTEKAQWSKNGIDAMQDALGESIDGAVSIMGDFELDKLEVFGEAFGAGIQKGGRYGPHIQFAVFDMRINDSVWLPWDQVLLNAESMNLQTVPFKYLTTGEAVENVVRGWNELSNTDPEEGYVLKTDIPLLNNQGKRVVAKLKHCDF